MDPAAEIVVYLELRETTGYRKQVSLIAIAQEEQQLLPGTTSPTIS